MKNHLKEKKYLIRLRPIINEVTKSKYIDKKDWFKPPKKC